MKVARFTNGDSVLFDRMEEHEDKVLFFRAPLGLVQAKTKEQIEKIEDATSN